VWKLYNQLGASKITSTYWAVTRRWCKPGECPEWFLAGGFPAGNVGEITRGIFREKLSEDVSAECPGKRAGECLEPWLTHIHTHTDIRQLLTGYTISSASYAKIAPCIHFGFATGLHLAFRLFVVLKWSPNFRLVETLPTGLSAFLGYVRKFCSWNEMKWKCSDLKCIQKPRVGLV